MCVKQGVAEQLSCCFLLRSNPSRSEVAYRPCFQGSVTYLSEETCVTESI